MHAMLASSSRASFISLLLLFLHIQTTYNFQQVASGELMRPWGANDIFAFKQLAIVNGLTVACLLLGDETNDLF